MLIVQPKNAPEFICPICLPKLWMSMKKRLHWASVVCIYQPLPKSKREKSASLPINFAQVDEKKSKESSPYYQLCQLPAAHLLPSSAAVALGARGNYSPPRRPLNLPVPHTAAPPRPPRGGTRSAEWKKSMLKLVALILLI